MFYLAALGAMCTTSPMIHTIPWRPEKAHRELHAIAGLESSWGLKQNHRPHSRGPFHTAYGPVGLKASTAYTEYMRSPSLRQSYPDLQAEEMFLKEFVSNQDLYYACANKHWAWLRKHTQDSSLAVYSWRWGFTAATKAAVGEVAVDAYVSRYSTLNNVMTATRVR